jgi:DNA-binding XRE family transcriptional regulator
MHESSVTPAQLRAGRALLGLSQAELAKRASVTVEAIAEAEADGEAGASEASQGQLFKLPLRGMVRSFSLPMVEKGLASGCGAPGHRTRGCVRTS